MDPENEEIESLEETTEEVEQVKPAEQAETRYVPYHHPEEAGIVDTETNLIVGNDVFVVLTKILNELDEIKKSQG